jgi:hypothetical protein
MAKALRIMGKPPAGRDMAFLSSSFRQPVHFTAKFFLQQDPREKKTVVSVKMVQFKERGPAWFTFRERGQPTQS